MGYFKKRLEEGNAIEECNDILMKVHDMEDARIKAIKLEHELNDRFEYIFEYIHNYYDAISVRHSYESNCIRIIVNDGRMKGIDFKLSYKDALLFERGDDVKEYLIKNVCPRRTLD